MKTLTEIAVECEPFGYVSDATYSVTDTKTVRKTPNVVFKNPVFASPQPAIPEGWKLVRIEPRDTLLYSMALRYDHSLALPDQATRLTSIKTIMRQLHEEVLDVGFYREPQPAKVTDQSAYIKRLETDVSRLREFIERNIECGEDTLKRKQAVKHELYECISMMVGVSRIALDHPQIFAHGSKLDSKESIDGK